MSNSSNINKNLSFAGLIITLGIVYGDIGTSCLYVMKAVTGAATALPNENFVLGVVSCVIWTLTIQTTIKYVMIALTADNNGEGGIFSLYSLIKSKKHKWLYIVAIIGAAALVSDGIITPPMTIISAIEGLRYYNKSLNVVDITIIILVVLFVMQQFGTKRIGKMFGPVMVLWFFMLAVIGMINFLPNLSVLKAFNPVYAIKLIISEPNTMLIIGAVFLCTTGAEALYSDLGHCGIKNIRISWIYVKICLIFNYLGQGAWILANPQTSLIKGVNPFFSMVPESFMVPAIIMATLAAIIASQALISGSFTIFSEAMSLMFWPRQKIQYPDITKGRMYIPMINWTMLVCCIFVVLHFKSSSAMEAAYGFAITITMLMTTILLIFYLISKHINAILIFLFAVLFIIVETGFFYANALKFAEGGYIAILLAAIIAVAMWCWYSGQRLKNKFIKYVEIKPYLPIIQDIKNDKTIPKYCSNLVYISNAKKDDELDAKIFYSIIDNQPKRADVYWFLVVTYDKNPYTFEYDTIELIKNTAYKIKFNLGFKIEPLIGIYLEKVIAGMNEFDNFDTLSNYPSLRKHNISGDFKFVMIERVFPQQFSLIASEKFILKIYNFIKRIGISDQTVYGLDSHNVVQENVPISTDIIQHTYLQTGQTDSLINEIWKRILQKNVRQQ